MVEYIETLIPLAIGILCITSSKILVKPDDINFKKKTSTIKNCGWLLAGLAVIFALIKYFSH
jgi:hypothetical protein